MSCQYLIRQAQIFLPQGNFWQGDVLLGEGKILAIAAELNPSADSQIIEAQGLLLLPGVIDPQVHFREPGLEHKEDLYTASRACARGGVTSFLEMPNTKPLTITQAALEDKLARAAQKSLVNYGFFIGATAENLPDLNTASPTCGIKIFMGSAQGPLLVSTVAELEPIFAGGQRLIAVHAEDQARILERRQLFAHSSEPAVHSQIQDETAALYATQTALALSEKYRRRLHILHLSTGVEANYLRTHKLPWVTAEVTPQHLLLNTNTYAQLGTLAQMNPPLRTPENNEILWQALLDGVIDFIATDHAPHTLTEKAQPYPQSPSGMPGVETALPLMLTQAKQGRCRVDQVVQWMSTAVAQAYKIPNKGKIEVGADADVILVDWENYQTVRRTDLQTKCGWSPFEGWSLTGWPIYTFVLGQLAYSRGVFDDNVRGKALRFDAP